MTWTIGQAARRAGCPASTIRYYERIGLLSAPRRGANGYRYYDDAALERLRFVHRARTMGFPVAAVRDLLRLADHPHWPCDDVDHVLDAQLDAVHDRIAGLQRLETELAALRAACEGGHEIRHCGVLQALSRDA